MTYPKGYKPPYKPPPVPEKQTFPKGYVPPAKTYPKEDTSPTISKGSLSKEDYLSPIPKGYKAPPYYGKRSPSKRYSSNRKENDRGTKIAKLIVSIITAIIIIFLVINGIQDAINRYNYSHNRWADGQTIDNDELREYNETVEYKYGNYTDNKIVQSFQITR